LDISIFDPQYVQKQQTANLQAMAAQQNAQRLQTYTGQCATWVTNNLRNRDLGLPLTAVPTIPNQITVADDGTWTEAPFVPPLQPPVLPPPVAPLPDAGKIAATTNVPPDRIDQVIAILQLFNTKLDTLLKQTAK
jgi:hypothetical protein